MENSSNSGGLPYSYAPLPSGNEVNRTKKPNRIGLVILCGLMVSALVVSLVGYNPNTVPESDDGSVKGSRGKVNGVSEKVNGLALKGLRGPLFDWNDLQLSWQRSSFHFQPQKNWMNDPNGPMYYNGWYHFFYQYNPGAAVWGDIVWGHSVSKDLIRWVPLPIAMVPDQWYDSNGVWTGSATILPDGQIMMLYTGSTNESVQVQNLAYPVNLSDPLLVEWVKFSGNPVLVPPPGIGLKDFRDPTTAWKTSEDKWRITIGSKLNRTGIALIYDTTDFINFELKEGVLHGVKDTGMWECVDFYPVSLSDTNGLDSSTGPGPLVKHVLKASMDDDRQDYYALGRYNEKNRSWVPDDATLDVGIGLRYDYGGKWYASKTFYDQEKKRRILWGWMPESDSEATDIQKGWSSVQAIPRTILYDKKTGKNLIQWPVEEVETLRYNNKDFTHIVPSGAVVPLDVEAATQIDIVAEFEIEKDGLERMEISEEKYSCPKSKGSSQRGALGPFGFIVLANDELTEQTPVYFYLIKTANGSFQTFFCSDLSRSSIASDVEKNVYGSTVPVLQGEKLSMRILVDHSIIEGYAQGGRTCITSRVYPTKAIYRDAKLYLFNNATSATVNVSVKTWQMNPAEGGKI